MTVRIFYHNPHVKLYKARMRPLRLRSFCRTTALGPLLEGLSINFTRFLGELNPLQINFLGVALTGPKKTEVFEILMKSAYEANGEPNLRVFEEIKQLINC